ncbi:serine protease inhibitor ecotin [Novosphingobium sp. BL-8H]|uniref:serine protease inhibitor ecotin n=1 Tax=Novosphingobium sp. BL-8H TaxID=3127640 RepID=UPI003758129D
MSGPHLSHLGTPSQARLALGLAVGLAMALGLAAAAGAAPAPAQRTPADELKAFPPAPPGQVRRVIFLPRAANEDAMKVGVIVGRTMVVDCNRHAFGSRMEKRTVTGWGYDYYVVTTAHPPASTMMACPPNSQSKKFVRSADEPMLRYNSRLPIVIYAAPEIEIRTRIWRAGPETTAK